jgi:phosphoglycerol transferase
MALKKRLLFLVCVLVFFLATSILFAGKWVRNAFGEIPVEQIAFHLVNPMDGVDPAFVYSIGRILAAGAVLSALYAVLLARTLRGKGLGFVGSRGMGWILGCATVLMLALSAGYTQHQYGILTFFNPARYFVDNESTFFDDNYLTASDAGITFPGRKNNLVLLILESAESTFNREELFGEKLMPALDKLARDNISFSRSLQCAGTEWSVAGICNYFLGVPLLQHIKIYDRMAATFLPGAESILRTLADNGYSVDFMIGTDSRFAGHQKVILTHAPGTTITGSGKLRNARDDYEENESEWGVYDSYLFDRARELLSRNDRKQPFALIVETMNTHSPGYPQPDNPRRWNDYRDCFPELDANTGKFLAWLKEQDFAADTTIVILGDHLAMTENLGDVSLPPRAERTVYNAIVNSRRRPDNPGKERLFASWDMAPTILESVGADLPARRFGLGVSLFSDYPTLLEKYGAERYEEERRNPSRLYSSLYSKKRAASQALTAP